MWKKKYNGGIKLVNIQLKRLMEMTVDENRSTNLNVFTKLMGTQRGGIEGVDLLRRFYLVTCTQSSKDEALWLVAPV